MIIPPLPYKWIGVAAALAAVAAFFFYEIHAAEKRGYAQGQNELRAVYEKAADEALAAKKQAEDEIANLAAKSRQRNIDDQVRDSARIADLNGRLLQRAARSDGDTVPSDSAPSANCTGTGLYRDDGQFLVWFASEAARIVRDNAECRERYDQVKSLLDSLQ